MCGIAGELRFGDRADVAAVERMAESLAPRGPDSRGLWAQGPVAFGHRRLTIIDLSSCGAQPMHDPDLGLTIVFNGCIYNYKSLRAELERAGYRFFSRSDTEVILKAYHAWGDSFVDRLVGMWASGIHERTSGEVLLGRDRLGIKPLYLSETSGRLRFASSLPAIVAAGDVDTSIDPVALHHYLSFHSVVPAPLTILRGVRKLPPATLLRVAPDGERSERIFWAPTYERDQERSDLSPEEWSSVVLKTLRRAVDRRMIADVPVGVL